jgi:hypothetical protein
VSAELGSYGAGSAQDRAALSDQVAHDVGSPSAPAGRHPWPASVTTAFSGTVVFRWITPRHNIARSAIRLPGPKSKAPSGSVGNGRPSGARRVSPPGVDV